jgi:hypothetical protein
MSRVRHHRIFVASAVFLLLFTAVDLAWPQICGEEQGSAALGEVPANTPGLRLTNGVPASQDDSPRADDCFCCCAHVIAAAVFHLEAPTTITETPAVLKAQTSFMAPPRHLPPPRVS